MKISKLSKFVLSLLVAVGLFAPQQAKASVISMDGLGFITPPSVSGAEDTHR